MNYRYTIASGKWGDLDAAAARMLRALYIWMNPDEMWNYFAYICPICGYVVHGPHATRRTMVTCPLHHRVEMMRFPNLVEGEDSKRFEKLKDLLVRKLLLEAVARLYAGRPPEEWRLYFPPAVEAAFSDDPTVFRYAWRRNALEACLHRLNHSEFSTCLKKAAAGSHLELYVEVNPQFTAAVPPDAVYDKERGIYRIVEKP
jgi:hypothetical protein